MKSNIVDIKTKEVLFEPQPRNTLPGGIFIQFEDLILSLSGREDKEFLKSGLEEYAKSIRVPHHDLKVLLFIFDTKNSRQFLVQNVREKLEPLFEYQCSFE